MRKDTRTNTDIKRYSFYAELPGDAIPFCEAIGVNYHDCEPTGKSAGAFFNSDKSLNELRNIAYLVDCPPPFSSFKVWDSLELVGGAS